MMVTLVENHICSKIIHFDTGAHKVILDECDVCHPNKVMVKIRQAANHLLHT